MNSNEIVDPSLGAVLRAKDRSDRRIEAHQGYTRHQETEGGKGAGRENPGAESHVGD